ncbi:protease [Ancylobacter sp. 6x-1]|uniref:Protease n=1 Tax=Ancylobacter crimeensis TaxID=2579147 RepID=A0ABT0DF40_9HYPH|nr:protease [Ancylobacter crimeensis]MCK0198563.1 protease [Ancylobacter crimeensis]
MPMIEFLMVLLGARLIRRKWWVLAALGVIWLAIGLFFVVNALYDEYRISPSLFAVPLLIDATVSVIAGIASQGTRRTMRLVKAAFLLAICALIMAHTPHSDMIIGILTGIVIIADGAWRAASAWVVRFSKWRRQIVLAGFEFAFGIWSFVPWPTQWRGSVGIDVGTLIAVMAVSMIVLALRIRRLPHGVRMATLFSDGWPRSGTVLGEEHPFNPSGTLTVHVWTPTGTLANIGVSRYVAALDAKGVVSTGHAALEAGGDVYVSHYPAVEIERDQSQFTRTLRATQDNDVPGKFQPSYAIESAEWCPSTRQVELAGVNVEALRGFWAEYSTDTTYNLTNRNCSSAVAKAVDSAVEGLFEREGRSPWFVARLVLMPELWAGGLMRRRAAAMAWTPGMVLDYARAISGIMELTPRPAATTSHPREARP